LVPATGNYFHLHLVSDSTGETLITVARAVAAQYANVTPVEHVYPLVRSQKQLDRVLDEIEEAPGIVLFTLLEKDLVGRLEAKCKDINIPSLSIIGPVMQLFEAYLGAATTGRVGAQHVLNAEYFKRIDALNYTMMHDDGQHVEGLEDADVVLVGVSRTSKTPTSIYLANRGSHARANPRMQKDGRIDPSACTLTLYSASGHVTGTSLSTGHRGSQRYAKDGGSKRTFVADKIIERERVSRDGGQAQLVSPGRLSVRRRNTYGNGSFRWAL